MIYCNKSYVYVVTLNISSFTVLTLTVVGDKMPLWGDKGGGWCRPCDAELGYFLTFRQNNSFQTANDHKGTKTEGWETTDGWGQLYLWLDASKHLKFTWRSLFPRVLTFSLFSSHPPAHHHTDTRLTFQVSGLSPSGQPNHHDLYRSWWIIETQEPCAPRNQVQLTSL